MPFASKAQRKYLFANAPKTAQEFASHTPKAVKLPERKEPRRKKKP